ncbi:uncharacterized protein LOC131950687 [Physella acuta]|uniref:uncharacterized protein LOC131950687 n=1 Tax=Physella acuta TaxID=109671 RepID=UPI0027DCB2DC|nr:uncharacterized protein LOC131950687 [Physella acuta]XP_059168895.1 uncharacterized protein LOC131950687 [Physella acuta]
MKLKIKIVSTLFGIALIFILFIKDNSIADKISFNGPWGVIRVYINSVVNPEGKQLSAASNTTAQNNKTFVVDKIEDDVPSITIVTMFLNLGTLQKWSGTRTLDRYKQWMTTWGWLKNPVVAFFEDEEILQYFKQIRTQQPAHRTVIVKISRSQLGAFKNLERIQQVYKNSSYSKLSPTMINANYSCTMSAKYDALIFAMDHKLIRTKYLAWMDIGLFRNLIEDSMGQKNKNFTLEIPPDFNNSRIGFTEVAPRHKMERLSPWDYIKNSYVWLAGGYVMGTQQVIRTFVKSYKSTVQELLKANMSSTDEQIIGAMYSPEFRHKQELDIQGYSCVDGQFGLHNTDAQYFCLSYICKDTAEKAKNKTSILKGGTCEN